MNISGELPEQRQDPVEESVAGRGKKYSRPGNTVVPYVAGVYCIITFCAI